MRRSGGRRSARSQSASRPFATVIRSLGAIAHFDPSVGATDDGTTSTWVDRIGGYTVASTSQASRMTYSSAISGLNNRPGWVGVAASSTKLTSSNNALSDQIDGSVAYSMYVVHKSGGNAAVRAIVGCGSTTIGSFSYLFHNVTTGNVGYSRSDAGSSAANTGSVSTGTTATVTSLVYSGTQADVWCNGVQSLTAFANTKAGVCDRFVVGAVLTSGSYLQSMEGSIGDIIVFLGAHATSTRQRIEQLLAARYGF